MDQMPEVKEGTLMFPSNATIADFLVSHEVRGMLVDSKEYSITGNLPAALVADACKWYGAYFKSSLNHF